MHVTMAGISQDFVAVPLDLSIKQPPSVGTVPSSQESPVPKTLDNNECESKALDLTRSAGAVAFHRAIPVTTTVPSRTENKNFGGLEKSRYVQSEKVEDGKEKLCHVSPVVSAGSSQQVPSCTHSSVQVTGVRPIRPKLVSPKEEVTPMVGQTPERLSPSTLTYQQQSAMRNFVAMDTSESHIPQRPASVGAPTVIVKNSLSSGYLMAAGRVPPVTAIPGVSLKAGTRMILPNSDLQRLNSLQSDRMSRREDDDAPPSKAKAVEGRGRGTVPMHHFQPYPLPRPPTCIHRSMSIPSQSVPVRSISPRMPMGTDSSASPALVPGMHVSLTPHHVTLLPGRSGLAPSGTADASVALTYSVLGTPKVASLQSKESGNKVKSVKSPKPEAAKPSQTPPMKESLKAFTDVSVATSKSESTNQGSLPINPFYPLSVAVDCHRATAQDSDGDTPLHIAIVQEQPDLAYVQRLIQLVKMSGKALDIFNYMQQTPLHLAAITNNIEVIRIMLEAGANPNEADRNGLTTVHHACVNRNSPCMAVIFKYSTFDIDLEKRNFNGHTPLHVAVEKCDKVLVRMLLEHRANVNAMDSRNGWTPLFIAVANKDIKMLGILVEFGAKVNAQSYSGNAALHIATGRGYTDVVKVLVQYGADLSLKNSHWDTPVNVANANEVEMNQLLRGICRGSPNLSSSPSQSFARESSTSPVNHPYHGTYSPPPTSTNPHMSITSHENVRNALHNKIHRKLSRDSLTPSSPVDKGRESPIGRRKIKSTKVVSVPVDGDSFRLGQLIPMTEGNKIPVITKSGAPSQDSDAPVLSNDSGIGSWRADSIPSIDKSNVTFEPVKQETSERQVTSTEVVPPNEETMEFTIQTSKPVLSEGTNVKVEKIPSISTTSETYENMEVDMDPNERTAGIKGPRNIAPRPVVPTPNAHLLMKTVDGGTFGLTHMFGLPVPGMATGSAVMGRTNVEVKKEGTGTGKVDSRGFDTTAVPVYRKAMQNGQQMSKSKIKVSPVNSPSPVTRPAPVAVAGNAVRQGSAPAPVAGNAVRQGSADSDDEGKLVIVEKGEMRTKPLKKTVSRSCPSSPSMMAKMPEKTGSPTPERTMET